MFNYGTTNPHQNRYIYGDIPRMDLLTSISVAVKVHIPSGNTGSYGLRIIVSDLSSISGWSLRLLTSDDSTVWDPTLRIGTGGTTLDFAGGGNLYPMDETVSIVARWVSGSGKMHVFGFTEVETVSAGVPATNTAEMCIGGEDAANLGLGCRVGQVMVWPNYFLTDVERDLYHNGVVVPAPANLGFWDPCTAEPGQDRIFLDSGTEENTVTLTSDNVDTNFAGSGVILPHREVVGRNLRIFRMAPEVWKAVVPGEFLSLELGDEVGLAHPDIPRASSILADLDEHYMLGSWRQMYCAVLEREAIEASHEVALTLLNMEPSITYFYNSLRTTTTVNDEGEGTAVWNLGATQAIDRASAHYIADTSELADATQLAAISLFSPKTNHRGTIYEDGYTNIIGNSAALEDGAGPPAVAGWAENLGTGGASAKVGASTVIPLFRDPTLFGFSVTTPQLTKSSDADDWYELVVSTDTSGIGRLCYWTRDTPAGAGPNTRYFIQRTSDSQYWTGTNVWSATKTWHEASERSSTQWVRSIGNVITGGIPSSGTLNIGIGQQHGEPSVTTGDLYYFGHVQFVQQETVRTDIVTLDGATATAIQDEEIWSLDNGGLDSRQIVHPDHGTIRMRIRLETNLAEMPTTQVSYVLAYSEFDSDDWLLLDLLMTSSVFQLRGRRNIGGVGQVARMNPFPISVRGAEAEIAMRWTSSAGELGLVRTLSVFVDGVKGETEATASTDHPSGDQTTELWIGARAAGMRSLAWR